MKPVGKRRVGGRERGIEECNSFLFFDNNYVGHNPFKNWFPGNLIKIITDYLCQYQKN